MTYKLFDIIPPKYNKSSYDVVFMNKSRNFKLGYFILILIVIICLGAYFLVKPNLEIDVWPNLINDRYTILVRVSTSTSAVDLKNLSIPGFVLTKEVETSQEFESSKETVQSKAQGTIRVYNNYSSKPITLIKNTRFMSSSGKVFLAINQFTIPGKPLYKDVKVIAAEAGDSYNIKPSSFSIPGLRGTPLYTSVYGKSFQAMSGGHIGEVHKVTKEDLDRAKKVLIKLGSEKAKNEILKNKPEDTITLNKTMNYSLEDFFPLAEEGQNISSFTAKERIKSSVLSFKKEDLDNLVKEYVLSKLPKGQKVDFDYLNFSFNPEEFDINNNTIKINIKSRRYLELDKELLKGRIAGCRKVDIASLVLDVYPHLLVPPRIELFPFWARRAPKDQSRIKIRIHLES